MSDAYSLSLILLGLFALLSALDGLYFHLWKYRLHTRAESRGEHLIHTLRSLLFPAIVLTLYAHPSVGFVLWLGVGLVVLDAGAEFWDVWIERDSREEWGGLSSAEYLLHVVLTILRTASLALNLVARPVEAWYWSTPGLVAGSSAALADFVTRSILPGAIGVALLHLWLLRPRTPEARAVKEENCQNALAGSSKG